MGGDEWGITCKGYGRRVENNLRKAHTNAMKQMFDLLGLVTGKISAFILLFVFPLNLLGSELPQNKYLEAYVLINEGDKYFANQEWALADERYILGMKMLKKIKADFPEWEPSIVDHRLEYLRKKIKTPPKEEDTDKVEESSDMPDQGSKGLKTVMEIEISSRLEMPFNEQEILEKIPIRKGFELKSEEVDQSKEILLTTGKYKSVEITEFEHRDDRGRAGTKIIILIDPNISQAEVEEYYKKSSRPENLVPKKAFWGKYYYANQDGIGIIPAEFEEAYPFEGEYACVKQNGRYGLIDATGKFVVPPLYSEKISYDSIAKAVTASKGERLNTTRLPEKTVEVRRAVQQPHVDERGGSHYQINLDDNH